MSIEKSELSYEQKLIIMLLAYFPYIIQVVGLSSHVFVFANLGINNNLVFKAQTYY